MSVIIKYFLKYKKYIFWVVGAISLFIAAKKLFGMLFKKKSIEEKADEQTDDRRLKRKARKVSHALGTNKTLKWYQGLTEDEKETVSILKPLDYSEFQVVKRLYREVYTDSRSLPNDLLNYLPDRRLEEISHLV
jgi:hypothetical protein